MSPRSAKPTPASLGFAMPAEWDRHEATWLAWPHNEVTGRGSWRRSSGCSARWSARSPPARSCGSWSRATGTRRRPAGCWRRPGADMANVAFHRWPTNRAWMRDFGPIGIRRVGRNPEVAVARFKFTAWGYKYPNWHRDNQVPLKAAQALGLRLFRARVRGRDFALEGGGIDVNGRGTILATEECFLHPTIQVRNPGATRDDYEAVFRDYLGAPNVLWLGRGMAGDDTHGHVDDLCRFVSPDTVVLVQESDPKDVNYRPAAREPRAAAGDAPGGRVEGARWWNCRARRRSAHGDQRLPASYANFYICERRGPGADVQRPPGPPGPGHPGRPLPRAHGRRHPRGGPGAGLRHGPLPLAAAPRGAVGCRQGPARLPQGPGLAGFLKNGKKKASGIRHLERFKIGCCQCAAGSPARRASRPALARWARLPTAPSPNLKVL